MRFSVILLALLATSVLTGASFAQQSGAITGRVVDASGRSPLPGAHVVAKAADTERAAVTSYDGRFELSDLPAETYTVEASMVGYANTRVTNVAVRAGSATEIVVVLEETSYGLDEVVVSATRMATPLSAVSRAVTILDERDLDRQRTTSNSLGDVLGKLVPGLGVSTGSPSIYGQSLRGRTISVMIDGVPQSTTRNTSRDFETIDPGMIERVEVVRGATSIYGDGATGGIINIITKRPAAGAAAFTTDVQAGGALSAPADGLKGRIAQSVSGRRGALDFTASASLARTSGFYDAQGDLIPPDPYGQGGLANTTSIGLHGQSGYAAGNQRIRLTLNHYQAEQETDFVTDPAVEAQPPGEAKARAMEGLHLDRSQGSWNTVASVDYDYLGLSAGRIHAQLFYRDYLTRFRPFDGRPYVLYQNIIQSFLESTKIGGRAEIEKTFGSTERLTALAGIDVSSERTQQPVFVVDSTTFDQSGGLRYEVNGQRPWVPLMNPRKLGLFTQFRWDASAHLDLQGGIRYEPTSMHIDDFTTLVGNEVVGGEVAYDPVLFNGGFVFHATEQSELYGSFSQGFSLTDLGLLLRNGADGFEVGNRTLRAQKVNNYDAGVRLNGPSLRGSAAAFYNQSDLGTTSAGLDKGVVRAPERVYGVEATLDVFPAQDLSLGGTFTWTEGENDANEDGDYLALNTYRIQPLKVTGYVEHETLAGWTNRLQFLYSGDRDRAFEERANPDRVGFGERAVDSYLLVDLVTSFAAGPGRLEIGITNLLNSQYFPVVSQLMWNGQNSSHSAGPGATLNIGYSVTY